MIGKNYQKYKKSNLFNDKELSEAIVEFTQLERELRELGDKFHFSWKEAFDVLNGLKEMQKARKTK